MDFNLDLNIFLVYPEFKEVFKSLIEKEGEDYASVILWNILRYIHPESMFAHEREKSRAEKIKKYSKLRDDFEFTDYLQEADYLRRSFLTTLERSATIVRKKLHEKDAFLESVPYDAETYEMVEKMLKDYKALWASLEDLEKRLVNATTEDRTQGGGEESFLDKLNLKAK